MAQKPTKNIPIADIDLQDLVVPIVGITSLLTNRITEVAGANVERNLDRLPKFADTREAGDGDLWLEKCHLCDPDAEETNGRYGLPAAAFRNAMVAVGRNKGASGGISMAAATQMFQVMGDIIPIRCRVFRKRTDPAITQQKKLIATVRPEFIDWEVELLIRFNNDSISAAQVINLVNQAGFAPGVGSWRPGCKGNHGMFEVKADTVTMLKQV